jgi:predicted TIM-barrel fold metal-dependent hydrolase
MYMQLGSPMSVDRVATDMPELTIVCSHGGWPFTNEMIAIAWRHERVYFETSLYENMPGAGAWVEAANTILMNKVLFASGYPARSFPDALSLYRQLPLSETARSRVMHENARDLLQLPTQAP